MRGPDEGSKVTLPAPHSAAHPLSTASPSNNPKRLVVRNTLISLGGQIIGTPLSILVTAIMARHLGAADFGHMYLAWMMTLFGFLFVEWGQGVVLTGTIARDRSLAGVLLGTTLVWRCAAAVFVYALLALGSQLLNYEREFQVVLALVVVQCLFQALSNACQDGVRGFERTDVGAAGQVAQQLLMLVLVVPTLLLGGALRGVLVAQAAASAIVLVMVWWTFRHVGVGKLMIDRPTLKRLLREGTPFMIYGGVITLQPNVDAILLSKLSPEDVVGWHAVARRLIGTLVLPGSLVIGALYPTLSRLFAEDRAQFIETARGALRATVILSVPIAMCCGFYGDIGIQIFSKEGYGPAQQNLVVLAPFLFLMYFSMPLGISILAAGRQKIWAATQFVCVLVSSVLEPFLIPWFQSRYGNGGLGVCIANIICEVVMVAGGIALCEKGILDSRMWLGVLRSLGAGVVMGGVALLLLGINSFIAAPVALLAYLAALWALGGLGREQLALLRSAISKQPKAA